jgi:hypothetical protein
MSIPSFSESHLRRIAESLESAASHRELTDLFREKGLAETLTVPNSNPKVKWPIEEQDAMDLLTMVSYLHRRLDRAYKVPQATGR